MLKLNHLSIRNFRNIKELDLKIDSSFTCFVGENAQGKTNILESVYLLSNLRSFRYSDLSTYLKEGEEKSIVKADLKDNLGAYNISYELTKKDKKYFLNKKPVQSIRNIVSDVKIIAYTPDTYNLISGEDSYRRNFLDKTIFFTDDSYINDLINYNKVLKNRNAALKNNKDYTLWDNLYCKYSEIINKNRIKILDEIKPFINNYFNKFFKNIDLNINYKNTLPLDKNGILEKIKKDSQKDEKLGFTNSGPNRDKIEILLNNKEVKKVFSTGQIKLLAFIFKLAEIEIVKNFTKKNIIFLYDDVSAFLDKEKITQLIEIIKEKNIQILSSSVDNSLFKERFSDSVLFITVRDGRLVYDK